MDILEVCQFSCERESIIEPHYGKLEAGLQLVVVMMPPVLKSLGVFEWGPALGMSQSQLPTLHTREIRSGDLSKVAPLSLSNFSEVLT